MDSQQLHSSRESDRSFEIEKWVFDCKIREREITIKERELVTREGELALKQAEQVIARWKSPLFVAIFAAAIAGAGNAIVAYLNGNAQIALETTKSEQSRILEMIKTGDPDKAAENLGFLLDAGLILDSAMRRDLSKYLESRKPGTGPTLPSSNVLRDPNELISKFEGSFLKPFDTFNNTLIGHSHVLTPEEVSSGTIMIDGAPVDYKGGITEEQANSLLQKDQEPCRKAISELVKVKLTKNQEEALLSFINNVGIGVFKKSDLLIKLNEGKYEEVPLEFMKYTRAGGKELPGLLKRREAEALLWKKK